MASSDAVKSQNEERCEVTGEVRSEMVANVWKVEVALGDRLEEGDTIAILESMKMESPVLAEVAGSVKQLEVREGDSVQEGDLIAVVG